jgi:hypothetical protein
MMQTPQMSWRAALSWRFGVGAALVLPRAVSVPLTGWVGNGTSVPVSAMPSEQAMLVFGGIDRALAGLPARLQVVLALAYGDRGSAETENGMLPQRRWRAVAPLTPTAQDRGEAWARHQERGPRRPVPGAGPPAVRWWQHVTARGAVVDQAELRQLRREAEGLIEEASRLFVAAYPGRAA